MSASKPAHLPTCKCSQCDPADEAAIERYIAKHFVDPSKPLSDEQVKHMVDRFLSWRLPEDFQPDAGISFEPGFNVNTPHPMKHRPTGTNLFTATQAEAMIRFLIDGLPEGDAR